MKSQAKPAWIKQLSQCSLSFWCSMEVLEKGDERESRRNGWYLGEPKEWLIFWRAKRMVDISCYKQSPREVSWSGARGFRIRYNSAVKFWLLSCCWTHVTDVSLKDISLVPLPEEKQKAMDSTQYHSVWFYYGKSHKIFYAEHRLGIYRTFNAGPFALYLSWQWRSYYLRAVRVLIAAFHCCVSWTDCWWLFLPFLSHKDNFIWRNLSCTHYAGPLHLFSAVSTQEDIQATQGKFQITKTKLLLH